MKDFRTFLQDHFTSFRTILLSFLSLIFIGAFLLCLPVCSASGRSTPFPDALFTATSAVCVTGLVVCDTAASWSVFGKCVLLFLIQIGGLGVMTIAVAVFVLTGQRISILQRSTMRDSISAPQIGGIVRLTGFILKVTLLIEAIGSALLSFVFIPRYGVMTGIGYALFHSVSAFCNAGFDLMGTNAPYTSLTAYAANIPVNLIIISLIICGGLGFLTWQDLLQNRFRFHRLRLQTKIILTTTLCLIIFPFVILFFFEFTDVPFKERILLSLFQSVTPRTAGFNTYDYASMSENSLLMTILLMLIGGAPGSAAGGMKVTTFYVVVASAFSSMRQNDDVNCFMRRLDPATVRNAHTLLFLYLFLLIAGAYTIAAKEHLPIIRTLFECASALGTVGLTTGITPGLSHLSRAILILFMYFGRVGGLTLAYASVSGIRVRTSRYPMEKISVG